MRSRILGYSQHHLFIFVAYLVTLCFGMLTRSTSFAVLDFCNTMVEKGVVADSLASLLLHVVGNLFVNHSHWKYQQWHERWIITTKVRYCTSNSLGYNYFRYIYIRRLIHRSST